MVNILVRGCDTYPSLATGQTPGTDFLSYYDDDWASFLLKSLIQYSLVYVYIFHFMRCKYIYCSLKMNTGIRFTYIWGPVL
jgi:hypothetical protein